MKLISKKNLDEVMAASFAGNTAAIDKAKTVNGDIAQLKEAVDYTITGTGDLSNAFIPKFMV